MKKIKDIYNKLLNDATEIFFKIGIAYFIVSIVLLLYFGLNSAFVKFGMPVDPLTASYYGSFIGGFFSPLVGFASTFFLISTIVYQAKLNRTTQIESAIYKLIDYHKENADKMLAQSQNMDFRSNEAIMILNKKFDKIFQLIGEKCQIRDEKIKIDIAYTLLFYGISNDSKEILKSKISCHFPDGNFEAFFQAIEFNTPRVTYRGHDFSLKLTNEYQLGHYFRNLYGAVLMIDEEESISKSEKDFYMKLLRTQLSTPEIWLLFLNSLSRMGKSWNEKGFINKYNLIKNIPQFYSPHINPENHYQDIEYEYKEIGIS